MFLNLKELFLLKALKHIPATLFKLSDLLTFSEKSFHKIQCSKSGLDVQKNLLASDLLARQDILRQYQQRNVYISEERMCPRCLKRIGNSAFVTSPQGSVFHIFCT
jgi:Vam6/Vps39-like protein vacuolar protein sorting-associated protein 39